MLVSIITSVYNCEQYLSEMIDSIISQSFNDWEMIIIDDASTDKTWSILSSYDDARIIKIRNEVNRGLTCNLNKAWDIAKGKYIIRIDGDDIAYEGRIKKQVRYMEEHPEVIISGSAVQLIGSMETIVFYNSSPGINKACLIFDSVLAHPTMIINKVKADLASIKYDESLKYAQDYGFEYRASQYGDITAIPQCCIKYRMHQKQVSSGNRGEQIKYADITRKRILNDLGVTLNDVDMDIWSMFCRGQYLDCIEHAEKIQSIKDLIMKNNENRRLFDQDIFEFEFDKRFNDMNKCNASAVQKAGCISDKYERMFVIQGIWNTNIQCGKNISEWLKEKSIKSVAIYGMGVLGKNLFYELNNRGEISVEYIMDQNMIGDFMGKKVMRIENGIPCVDAIIITVISQYSSICAQLKNVFCGEILSLEDIIHETSLL